VTMSMTLSLGLHRRHDGWPQIGGAWERRIKVSANCSEFFRIGANCCMAWPWSVQPPGAGRADQPPRHGRFVGRARRYWPPFAIV